MTRSLRLVLACVAACGPTTAEDPGPPPNLAAIFEPPRETEAAALARADATEAAALARADGTSPPSGSGDGPPERSGRPPPDPSACRLPVLVATATTALGWPGAPIEEPERLAPFFAALDRADERRVRASVWGGSLIAADGIVSVLRETLQCLYGAGGPGFLLPDLMARPGSRARTGRARPELKTYNVGLGPPSPVPVGVAGVSYLAEAQARVRWRVQGARWATAWLRSRRGRPRLRARVDGERRAPFRVPDDRRLLPRRFALPDRARTLALELLDGTVAVDGVDLVAEKGVVVDTFGVPAADPKRFLRASKRPFGLQLQSLSPDLVAFVLGGNEVGDLRSRRTTRARLEAELSRFLERVRRFAPEAACLLVGPIEKIQATPRAKWKSSPAVAKVRDLQRRVGAQAGCAFFDPYAAMGGVGAIRALARRGWMHEDLIHPKRAGLDLIGALLTDALLKAGERVER